MKLRAGQILWCSALAMMCMQGGLKAAEPKPQGQSSQVVPVSAVQTGEDASSTEIPDAPGGLEELPPPPVTTQSFSPTYRTAAMVDETRFFRLQLGTYAGDNTGLNNGFMSLESRGGLFSDSGNSLFFLDGRLLLNEYQHAGANLGGGYRRYLSGPGLIFGSNLYYDNWNSGQATFDQIGAGVELLGENWEIRSNVYAPIGERNHQIGLGIGSIIGNDIYSTRNLHSSLAGMDLEYGRLLLSNEYVDLKGFLGTYYYDSNTAGDSMGVRARGEVAVGDFTRLNLSVQNDDIFDTTVMFGAEFTLPGRNRYRNPYRPSVYSRMTDRVERLQNIAVAKHSHTADTGLNAFFIQQTGSGDGTQATPYTLTDLSNDPNFGAGDVAVLTGGGTITGNIVIDEYGQQIIGSADGSGNASTIVGGNTLLSFTGLGTRPTLDGQIQFQTTGKASGFDMTSTTVVPIYAENLAATDVVVVQDVNILNSIDDGIHIENSAGQFQFLAGTTGGLIANVPGDGIQVLHSSTDVLLDNVTFQNVGGNAISTNYTGTFIGTGHTHIINPGSNGIYLANNISTFIFDDLTIEGGGNGLYLESFTGDFTVTGDAKFQDQQWTAITHPASAAGNTSNLKFGTLSIDTPGGYGIAMENHAGTFTVEGAATINDTLSVGLLVDGGTTDYKFGSLEITETEGFAASFENHTGSVTVDGLMKLEDFGALGMQIRNGSTSFNVGSLEVTDGTGVGLALENNTGNFVVQNAAKFEEFDGGALLVRNSSGNYSFGSLEILDADDYGISLENHTGEFNVDGAVEITDTGRFGLQAFNSNTEMTLGSLSVDNTSLFAVSFENNTGSLSVDGDVRLTQVGEFGLMNKGGATGMDFGSLYINGATETSAHYQNTIGDFTVDGDVELFGGINGLQILNSTTNVDLGSLYVADTTQAALVFQNVTGSVNVDGDVRTRNISNGGTAVPHGVIFQNVSGPTTLGSLKIDGKGVANDSAALVYQNSGALTITNEFEAEGFALGIDARDNTGDLTFGSVGVEGIGGNGAGMSVIRNAGDVIVNGDASFYNTGRHGAYITDITGDVGFGNLYVSTTSQHGLFLSDVSGSLEIAGDVEMAAAGSHGMYIENLGGDVSMTNLEIDGSTGSGVTLNNLTGDFTVTEDAVISNTHQGFAITDSSSDLNFGNLTISTTTANGLSINNNDGDVTVTGDAIFTDTGAMAILSDNESTGDFSFKNLSVTTNWASGVSMNGHSGNFTVTEDAIFSAAGGTSLQLQNTTGDYSFGNLTASGNWTNGVTLTNHQGDFTVNETATFTNTGGSAILSQTGSTGDLSFGDLNITTNSTSGLSLSGHQGDLTVTGDAVLTSTGSHGILAQLGTEGDYSFGSLSISNTWTNGIGLVGHTGDFTVTGDTTLTNTGAHGILSTNSVTGDLSFNNLTITGVSTGVALVGQQGNFTATGDTSLTVNGPYGLQIENGTGDISFEDLTITGATSSGISLNSQSGDFVSTGVTTITSPGIFGALIQNYDHLVDFNELNITNPGGNGVGLVSFNGEFVSTGGTISGINSNQHAFYKHDSGNGSVSLSDMIFSTESNDVFGLVTLHFSNGGSATLNNNQANFADNSTGTIGYRLGSYSSGQVELDGEGNTTTNAVQNVLIDTDANTFDGTVEVDGNDYPAGP